MTTEVDFVETGTGPTIVLVHSSVAGAGQWRSLMDELAQDYHLIAVNLFGYGKTAAWDGPAEQTLQDQANLLNAVLPDDACKFSIVGHSFGGAVAMKAAELFNDRVDQLILIEPNPFNLLSQADRKEAFEEALRLRNCIKENGIRGNWNQAAAVFADYWTGSGSWDAMPETRREKFAAALRPNFHEWDAVMQERTPLKNWQQCLPRKTTVISASDTVRSILEIVDLMEEECTGWQFRKIAGGGHMAPLTRPVLVNPLIHSELRQRLLPRRAGFVDRQTPTEGH